MRRTLLGLFTLLFALPASVITVRAAHVGPITRTWVGPAAHDYPLTRVAVLPVARSNDVGAPEAEAVGDELARQLFPDPALQELSGESERRLPMHDSQRSGEAIRAQIFRDKRPSAAAVPWLCGQLGCTSLLAVRVDRWERVFDVDPLVTIAYVEVVATLVDSTGQVLWRLRGSDREVVRHSTPQSMEAGGIGGHARAETAPITKESLLMPRPNAAAPQDGDGLYRAPGGKTDDTPLAHDFAAALRRIVTDWKSRLASTAPRGS